LELQTNVLNEKQLPEIEVSKAKKEIGFNKKLIGNKFYFI